MTLQEFLSSGNSIAIKKYKNTGILPSYVSRPKPKKNNKYSRGAAGMTLGEMKKKPKKRKITKGTKPLGISKAKEMGTLKAKEKRREDLLKYLKSKRKPGRKPRKVKPKKINY